MRARLLASLMLAVTACKSAPSCPTTLRTDAAKALADHQQRQSTWRSLKAEARVTQWGGKGRIRGTVLMFLKQPDRVRFDVMTQFGPAAVLTSDGDRFQLSDLREGAFLEGPTCPANIARLLGVSIDADQVLRLLTGGTPTIDAAQEAMECRDGAYVVALSAADGSTQEVVFTVDEADRNQPPDAQRLVLRRSTVREANGDVRWEAHYDAYRDVEGHSFPTEVRFIDATGAETSVRLKSIDLDPDVPEGVFQQTPAPGMSVELATCS